MYNLRSGSIFVSLWKLQPLERMYETAKIGPDLRLEDLCCYVQNIKSLKS